MQKMFSLRMVVCLSLLIISSCGGASIRPDRQEAGTAGFGGGGIAGIGGLGGATTSLDEGNDGSTVSRDATFDATDTTSSFAEAAVGAIIDSGAQDASLGIPGSGVVFGNGDAGTPGGSGGNSGTLATGGSLGSDGSVGTGGAGGNTSLGGTPGSAGVSGTGGTSAAGGIGGLTANTGGATPDAATDISTDSGPGLPSDFQGYWQGTTSQGLSVAFHVTAAGTVPDLLIRLRLTLGLDTCTAYFLGDVASLNNSQFSSAVAASGISVTPTVEGTFSSSNTASGTYTGSSGSYAIVCGSTLSIGMGTVLSPGTFAVTRISTCGNGMVETGEECDSAANCDMDCQRVPICGDAFVDYPETCDDGNTIGGDGCSTNCNKEIRNIAYPSELPATGQSVAAEDYVIYQISGVTAGTSYTVSTISSGNIDIYVSSDAAGTQQLCKSTSYSGNESCSATPTSGLLYVEVDNSAATPSTFALVVTGPSTPDAGLVGTGGGGSGGTGGSGGASGSGGTGGVGGSTVGPPVLVVSPSSVNFGSTIMNTESSETLFTFANLNGTTGTPSVALSDSVNFAIKTNTCTIGIAAGSSCIVGVVFQPKSRTACASVLSASASPGGTTTVTLMGTGIDQLTIAPRTAAFTAIVGSMSEAAIFTVTTVAGPVVGPLSAVLSGANSTSFALSVNNCEGLSLNAGMSCTVSVQFIPTSAGSKVAVLTVVGPSETAVVSLQGQATGL